MKQENATPKTKTTDLEKIAKDVIKGVYGNSKERKDKLTSLGYDYNEVQKLVNKMLKNS